MIAASVYIIACSARNRVLLRLRRLREPRYLLGAIVGAAYMYFSVFGRMRTRGGLVRRRGAASAPQMMTALRAGAPGAIGLALLAATAVSWIVPFNAGLLDFSQAEVQFLFPAPVSRRSLLLHRLLRSQIGIVLGSIIPGLVAQSLSGAARLRMSIATWLLLCTAKVYATGVALARARLGATDRRARRVAWLPLGVLLAVFAIVGVPLARAFVAQPAAGARDILARVAGVVTHGLPRIVLWPFVALAAPLFSESVAEYLVAMLQAAAVLAVCVVWMLESDATFQDAAEDVAVRGEKDRAARGVTYRVRSPAWSLATHGHAETAFAWKASIQTLRVVDRRSIFRLVVLFALLSVISVGFGQARGLVSVLGVFALVGAGFSILMAPQILRVDLRQDLRHLDLLKTWPVRPSAVIRGELAWPGAVLTMSAWALIGAAFALSTTTLPQLSLATRMSAAGAAMLLAPALVFAQLIVHNGVALMFPAWVSLGSQRQRGLDAMGQRLILLGGTWLLLGIMMLPGALVGAVVWFAFQTFVGSAALVPGAFACAAIVCLEVLFATEALGPLYDRLDILAIERGE